MDHQTFDNLGPIAGNRPQVIASTVKPLQRIQALAQAYNQWLYTVESATAARRASENIYLQYSTVQSSITTAYMDKCLSGCLVLQLSKYCFLRGGPPSHWVSKP